MRTKKSLIRLEVNLRRGPVFFGIFDGENVDSSVITGRTQKRRVRIEIQTV